MVCRQAPRDLGPSHRPLCTFTSRGAAGEQRFSSFLARGMLFPTHLLLELVFCRWPFRDMLKNQLRQRRGRWSSIKGVPTCGPHCHYSKALCCNFRGAL